MRKKVTLAVIAFAIVAAAATYYFANAPDGKPATVTLYPEDSEPVKITAEIADSPEERKLGLMHRQSLREDEGMIFIFPDSAQRTFWMKNTLIPLDIISLSEGMRIVKIHHAIPCVSDPCPTYSSEAPAMYVLEVNGNFTDRQGIAEGQAVKIAR
ncbi:DUF192 domain-containing protein [Candidatus Woesearchaeota archaeon]|nr:DUF192 domain-containing protein [Candidatus Woesearchaeota archaeon]